MGRDIWLGGGNILLNVEPRRYVDQEVLPKQSKMAPGFAGKTNLNVPAVCQKSPKCPVWGLKKEKKRKTGHVLEGTWNFQVFLTEFQETRPRFTFFPSVFRNGDPDLVSVFFQGSRTFYSALVIKRIFICTVVGNLLNSRYRRKRCLDREGCVTYVRPPEI